ncbi:MAG TPA: UMP kinase [Candidatus Saccharimonadales bacterium]|nr:UMP kinase [Candidatus Saccharimonadales bacterium]
MGSNYIDKVVISVGGSLIVPNGGINTDFLKKLNTFIRQQLASHPDRQFFLVIGGGATARNYIEAGKAVIEKLTHEDMDWLGIHSTRLNAHLIRTIFHDIAHPQIIEHYEIITKVEEPVIIASGWKPGWSTDFCAALICEDYGVSTVVNLSNIKQVYTADPRTNPDAQPIEHITWADFRKIVGDEWTPGLNAPFDPVASRKSQELGVKAVVMGGDDFENIQNYFDGKPFLGTVIE